jgi:hypothetical protein
MAKKHIFTLVKKTTETRTIEIVTIDDWDNNSLGELMWKEVDSTVGGDGTQDKWLEGVIEDCSDIEDYPNFQIQSYAIQTDSSDVPDADKHAELWDKLQLKYYPQEDGLWGEAKEQQI